MIRMYAHSSSESSFEIESPFCQIDILRNAAEPNSFRFNVNEKQTLPPLIFAAACFSFAHHNQPDLRSLSLHKIVYDFNSPGVAFKVSETEAGQLINEVTPIIDGVEFLESMGSQQLQFEKEPNALFWQVLDRYFKSTKKVSS